MHFTWAFDDLAVSYWLTERDLRVLLMGFSLDIKYQFNSMYLLDINEIKN